MSTEEPMSIEDRVRTATRAGATLVRDIGPLAADPEQVRFRRRPASAARRWGSWGIPLAAAAAVALVAVSLVAIRSANSGAPAGHPVTPAAPTAVPRYYVALGDYGTGGGFGPGGSFGALVVGDDQTGKTIATVNAPPGLRFMDVQGGSDDRTFVVLLENPFTTPGKSRTDKWYLLRIAPGAAQPYQLSKLPITLPSNSPIALAYALSPDGRELAIESLLFGGSANNVITLGVYSASSGVRLRAWTTDKDDSSGSIQRTLSWLPNGRQLAFSVIPPSSPPANQLRTLDLTAPGTDLLAASRAVLTVRTPDSSSSTCWGMHLAPDGRTVICGTQYALFIGATGKSSCANGGLEFNAYSVSTGQPERDLYQFRFRGPCLNGWTDVLWTGPSGSSIIGAVLINEASQGGHQASQLGVITNGRIRLLHLPKSVSPAYYGVTAF